MVKPNYSTGKKLAILLIGLMLIFIALNVNSEKIDATKSNSKNDFIVDGNGITSTNGVSITPDDKNGFVKVNDSQNVSFEYFATCFFDDLSSKNYSFRGSEKDFIWVADPKTGELTGTHDKSKDPVDKGKNVADFNVLFKFIPDKENAKFYSSIETDSRCVFTFDYIFDSTKPVSYISKDGKQVLIDSDISFDFDILVLDNFRIDLSDISKYAKSMSASRKDGKTEIRARLIFNLEKAKIELDPVINAGTADGMLENCTLTKTADNSSSYFYAGERGQNATFGSRGFTNNISATSYTETGTVKGCVSAATYFSRQTAAPTTVTLAGVSGTVLQVANPACNGNPNNANDYSVNTSYQNTAGIFASISAAGANTICNSGAGTPVISVTTYPTSLRGYLNFDISALSGTVKEAKLCVYVESTTTDAGVAEGTIDLRHIADYGTLTTADWEYTDYGDVNAAFIEYGATLPAWVCTNVDANIQADLDNGRTVSTFLLKHSLEDEDTAQAYFTITSGDAGANQPYLDVNTSSTSAKIIEIENTVIGDAFPTFNYLADGNISIDFNITSSDSNTARIDVNYNTTQAEGGTILYYDVNTDGSGWCAGADFSKTVTCSVDMNISPLLVSDGNYFMIVKANDGAGTDINISWASFGLNNFPPDTNSDVNAGTWQETDANVHLTCTSVGSACVLTQYRIDSDPSRNVSMGAWQNFDSNIFISGDGNWALDFNSIDGYGLIEDTNRQYVLIDQTAPTLYSYFPISDISIPSTNPASFNYLFTYLDDGSGVVRCPIKIWNTTSISLVSDQNVIATTSDYNLYSCALSVGFILDLNYLANAFATDIFEHHSADQNTAQYSGYPVSGTPPVNPPPITCGNGICDIGESYLTCPSDCKTPEQECVDGGGTWNIETSTCDEPPLPPVPPTITETILPPMEIPVDADYNAIIKVKRLTYNIIKLGRFIFDFSHIDYEITNLTDQDVKVYFEFSDEINPYVMTEKPMEYLELAPREKKQVSVVSSGQITLEKQLFGKLTFISKTLNDTSKNTDLINVFSEVGFWEFIIFGQFLFLPTWAWLSLILVVLGWYIYNQQN